MAYSNAGYATILHNLTQLLYNCQIFASDQLKEEGNLFSLFLVAIFEQLS